MGLLIVQSNFKDLDLYPLREVLKTTIHHGQGRQWRLLSGAAGHVQGMFQTYGRRQGWHLSKNDLRAAFDNVGKLMDESDLDSMLGEVGGSCTFDAMIKMFQEKMAGGSNDPDDLIVRAFKAYEVAGKIEAEMFRHALMNFGDKFNKAEVDDIFGEFEVDDDGFIESKAVIGLFVAGGGEEKKEEAPPPAEEAPAEAPAEDADDGGAKKKKKKKAAK